MPVSLVHHFLKAFLHRKYMLCLTQLLYYFRKLRVHITPSKMITFSWNPCLYLCTNAHILSITAYQRGGRVTQSTCVSPSLSLASRATTSLPPLSPGHLWWQHNPFRFEQQYVFIQLFYSELECMFWDFYPLIVCFAHQRSSSSPFLFLHIKFMRVLLTCMYVCHVDACFPQRSEEGIRAPDTGLSRWLEATVVLNPGTLQEQQVLLNWWAASPAPPTFILLWNGTGF